MTVARVERSETRGLWRNDNPGLRYAPPGLRLLIRVRVQQMNFIPRGATDKQVLEIARHWIDVLAAEDYAAFFSAIGYAMAYQHDCPGSESIRRAINNYRSPMYYPGVEEFVVSNWRSAKGGNPEPLQSVQWFKPNSVGEVGIVGAVAMHLPLNGRWSDLEADFVWFENEKMTEGYRLGLEDIVCPAQLARESDAP